MRSDELLSRLRETAGTKSLAAWPDLTVQRLFNEMNDKLRSFFGDAIVSSNNGYWLKQQNVTLTAGKSRYRIPARSFVGGLSMVTLARVGSTDFEPLSLLSPSQVPSFDSLSSGQPRWFAIQGEQIQLYPAPDAAYPVRIHFYIRPSLLCTSQSSTIVAEGSDAVDRGRITVVNTTTRQVTVNALPFDQLLGTPAAITSANQQIDIVHSTGWHELAMWSQSQTIAALVITIGGTDDMSDIEVGDYVRVAGQTDWAPLPEDFERILPDRAAMEVLREIGADAQVETLSPVVGAEFSRFKGSITLRVKTEPKQVQLGSAWRR